MSALLGTTLSGRYRLDARVGSGGMSMVYRAFDVTLERQVAIKLMNREVASDSDQLERFRREARAVAQLSHPHIVGVIDAGEDDGRPYIVFEYVEGETLKARIQDCGQLPIGEAVAYAIEIARALGAAHARHIVHRDVKPQNVLLDHEGRAKVTDFGIARTLDEDGLTADGRVLGTTDYVSPEQALGHAVTPQSDLYSLGIVLYEMLTGDVPFHGENQVAVAMMHVRETVPDVCERRPEASAALAAVVERATAQDLETRYASDEDLIADLEDVLALETARAGAATGEATSVLRTLPEPARRRVPLRVRSPWTLALVLVLVAAAIAAAAIVLLPRTQHGTGTNRVPTPHGGFKPIGLKSGAAHDYDPFGDHNEHSEQISRVIDGDRNTDWTTEHYDAGNLAKPGVGIYLDASAGGGVAAQRLVVRTPTPGFTAEVYAATKGPPTTVPAPGWTLVAPERKVGQDAQIALDTAGQRFSYYLLWITALPPGHEAAEITELGLFK